ncbi:ankyrin repeat domain-containing protein [Aspergillus mulundensis]|uniref:Nephrocystin 3-like N-terminal domain-containing protein n=1 Tax=Aspergillus mulundensis TaxID=1810919 RepID=A0A3D8SWE0_9EURO|nr:hypothetical protein DSM5745_02385 [Aspergillus mulundensis]RDW90610.1 hypothetical protein DSM5745_02385 [Aspergillus mulundensis]
MKQAQTRTYLWTAAFGSLTSDDKCRLQKYLTEKTVSSIDETSKTVQAAQSSCLQKRWTVNTRQGHRIIIRDILDLIALWLNEFKEVGDAVVQYGTAHASLSLAVAEGLEIVARLVAGYSIFEVVYFPDIGKQLTTAQCKLCDALVLLYAGLLRFLTDIGRYYERSTGTRILRSLYELSDRLQNPLKAAPTKEEEVEKIAQTVQAEIPLNMDVSIRTLQENSSQSFMSLESLLNSLDAPISRTSDEMLLAITFDCPATIIIDGLDELDGDRVELLTVLQDIAHRSASIVKIMISSREHADLGQELQSEISVPISPAEISSDIARYVHCQFDSAIPDKKLLGGRVSETLKRLRIKTLNEGAGGMFLWPALQLEYLCDRRTFKLEADIIAALKDLPPDLVLNAPRDEGAELRLAYLIDHGDSEEDADALMHAACKHGNMELAKRKVISQPPRDSDHKMYQVLASSGNRFPPGHGSNMEMQSQAIKEGGIGFLSALVSDYRLQFEFNMFRDVAWDTIRSKGNRTAILQFLIDNCSFHLVMVYLYSYTSLDIINSESWVVEKRKKETILYQAACLERSPEVVARLLQMGANPDSPGLSRTPLMSFMQMAHRGRSTAEEAISIVKLLLDHGADPDGARDTDREQDGPLKPTVRVTPLILAVARTFTVAVDTVRLLMEKGADVNHESVIVAPCLSLREPADC